MVPKTNALSIRPQGLAIASAACQHDSKCKLPCNRNPLKKGDPGRIRTCNRCFVSQPKRIGRARTNALSIWPQGQAHARKATLAGFEPAYVGFTVAPTPRGRGATNVCQNGKRIQCLIHSATGSSDHSKQRERRPWQDSNLQSLSDPTRDGQDVPMPYPFGHRVKCKDATRELQIGKEAGPGV